MPYYFKKKKTGKRSIGKTNLIKKLDKVFALYIRLRDTMPSGFCRCISCGRIKPFSDIDCGHFHSRTHMATRYSELNCNGECSYCNRFNADHLLGYRENLIKKIGSQHFKLLGMQAASYKKFDDFELKAMIDFYTNEVKKLSTLKGIKVNL